MKKLFVMAITLVLLVSSFDTVFAAPWGNPNGFWIYNVSCGASGVFDVWVPNNNTWASFNQRGEVGVSMSLYVDSGQGYEQVWKLPGNGVFKNTQWCEWTLDGLRMAGDILIQ